MRKRQLLIIIAIPFLLIGCGLGRNNSCKETSPQWVKRIQDITWPISEQGDSLIDVFFKYNQTVNGYEVTGRWRPFDEKSETGAVLLVFFNEKTGMAYQYWNEKYHSYDTDKISFANDFKGHKAGTIHYFNYTAPDTTDSFKEVNGNSPLGYFSPFQFLDIDFDGKDELLINDWYQGQAGNGYEVFKMTNRGLKKVEYMPLDRLTNMDRIDLKNKTITIVDFDGASDNDTFYFSYKKRKDRITDFPTYFFSYCTRRFDFEKYNSEQGAPFVLDSIAVYAERDVVHRLFYKVDGKKIHEVLEAGEKTKLISKLLDGQEDKQKAKELLLQEQALYEQLAGSMTTITFNIICLRNWRGSCIGPHFSASKNKLIIARSEMYEELCLQANQDDNVNESGVFIGNAGELLLECIEKALDLSVKNMWNMQNEFEGLDKQEARFYMEMARETKAKIKEMRPVMKHWAELWDKIDEELTPGGSYYSMGRIASTMVLEWASVATSLW